MAFIQRLAARAHCRQTKRLSLPAAAQLARLPAQTPHGAVHARCLPLLSLCWVELRTVVWPACCYHLPSPIHIILLPGLPSIAVTSATLPFVVLPRCRLVWYVLYTWEGEATFCHATGFF